MVKKFELKTVLTIAGSDSSGGAGIQADLKTMLASGVYGMSAITALTAQNTTGVTAVVRTAPEMLAAQLDSVFTDIFPDAIKTGMVFDSELIEVIAAKLKQYQAKNIVVDPVMVATSGARLLNEDAISALKEQLLESVAEEPLFKSMTGTNSPLLLFGKTIMTGAQEEIVNLQGLNMKRMYFVNGKDVTTNATLSMSKEQIKKLILAQMEKMMPEQADAIKAQIDQLMESGMLKLDAKETTTFKLQDDFWPKAWNTEATNESAGQKNVTKTTTTLK
jgi:hypothetical protein